MNSRVGVVGNLLNLSGDDDDDPIWQELDQEEEEEEEEEVTCERTTGKTKLSHKVSENCQGILTHGYEKDLPAFA